MNTCEGAFNPVTKASLENEAQARAAAYPGPIRQAVATAGVACDAVCGNNDHS
jgi:hypothetical protein